MCDHEKVEQESGDEVCVVLDCDDEGYADLIPSCCLGDTYEEDGIVRCSGCGVRCDDKRLEEGEDSAFHALNDYFGFGAENAEPPGPDALSEAWGVMRGLMQRFGIQLPEHPEEE